MSFAIDLIANVRFYSCSCMFITYFIFLVPLGSVVLNVTELGELVRSMGYEPSEQDLADPNGDRKINFIE